MRAGLLLISATVVVEAGAAPPRVQSLAVTCAARSCKVVPQGAGGATAWATYEDASIDETGWAKLHLATNASAPDAVQAFAAGFVEAALATHRTYQHRRSFFEAHARTRMHGARGYARRTHTHLHRPPMPRRGASPPHASSNSSSRTTTTYRPRP